MSSGLQSGIIGGTRWVKEGKTIAVYYDVHNIGIERTDGLHFNYIRTNILEGAAVRARPLTVLVENGCVGPHAELRRAVNRQLVKPSFLEQFDGLMGRSPQNNVTIKSIESRNVPFLIDTWVDEWCHLPRRVSEEFLRDLGRAVSPYTFKMIYDEALAQMKCYLHTAQGTPLEDFFQGKMQSLVQNLVTFKRNFCEQCAVASMEFDARPVADFFVDHNDPKRMRYLRFVGRLTGEEEGEFFVRELLVPLVDATLVHEALNAAGDVAVFAGVMHSTELDLALEELGYIQVDARRGELERLAASDDDVMLDLHLASTTIYDWMR